VSKEIGSDLQAHFAGTVTTLAICWRIARTDGEEFFFTNHDVDIVYDGDTYEAASGAMPSALSQDRGLSVDNMEATAFLESDKIAEADLQAGLYDMATIDIFYINHADPSMGVLYLCKDWLLGQVEMKDNVFTVELRGLGQRLKQEIVEAYSPQCRATLGDARCGIDMNDSSYWQEGRVTSVTDRQTFIASGLTTPSGDDDVFRHGLLTWLEQTSSGDTGGANNAGYEMEVRTYNAATGEITLFAAMPYTINVGDDFEITYGCDKKLATCADRFSNELNFRGEPWIPAGTTIPVTQWPTGKGTGRTGKTIRRRR
jgi:uncharacterized phage protein (TIGR02218 family)